MQVKTMEKPGKMKMPWADMERSKAQHQIPILLIEDDLDFAELIYSELEQIPGVQVSVANDTRHAIELLSDYHFDLVVSDWALDHWTAFDVLTTVDPQLDEFFAGDSVAKTPVLFMSGSEKINAAQPVHNLQHFEPVSFILKRFGPPLIGLLAENILERFQAAKAGSTPPYLS